MNGSLMGRYIYGRGTPPRFSPEGNLFWGIPERQRELIILARAQIATHQEAAEKISASQSEAAECIVQELRQQTAQLEESLSAGAEQVVSAVDRLAQKLSYELGEIRWELSQLRSGMEQVLAVLRRPRSTEAQELLVQGVRNLINNKLDEAQDRFLLAWKLDNTDFQVLLNLASVAIRRDDVGHALGYLKDALTLPEALDDVTKAETLWMTARVHYATPNYEAAFRIGKQSVTFWSTPRRLLELGIYGLLSGQEEQGLALIAQAVRQEPGQLALAASAPDLRTFAAKVGQLLESLVAEATQEVRDRSACLSDEARRLEPVKREAAAQLTRTVDALWWKASKGSYTDLRKAAKDLATLERVPIAIREWREAELAREAGEQAAHRAKIDWIYALRRVPDPGCIAIMVAVLGLVLLFVVFGVSIFEKVGKGSTSGALLFLLSSLFVIAIPVYLLLNRRMAVAKANVASAVDRLRSAEKDLAQLGTRVEATGARVKSLLAYRRE